MFRRVSDFVTAYQHLVTNTDRLLAGITDEMLDQAVADGHRTIREIAWHIVVTVPEMMNRTGLGLGSVDGHALPPATAREIRDGYLAVTKELIQGVQTQWNDDTLTKTDDMYGEPWPRGVTLSALMSHEGHHRGQLTVLMRQAGAEVPGVYGPSKEEWAKFGMEAPAY